MSEVASAVDTLRRRPFTMGGFFPAEWIGIVALLGLGSACSSNDGPAEQAVGGSSSGGSGSGGTASTGGGASDQSIGNFTVRLVDAVAATDSSAAVPAFTSVLGKIYDGAVPEQLVWVKADSEGACTLSTPQVPFCNPGCGSAVCVADGQCAERPSAQDVGAVTVSGMTTTSGDASFTLSSVAKSYQLPAGITLPYPAFMAGTKVTFSAAGADLAAFELTARGIEPLVLSAQEFPLDAAKPLEIAWTASSEPSSKIHVKLDISHHAGTKGMIECDGDDNGSLSIPAKLIAQLLDLGVAGYPTVVVTRSSTGSAKLNQGVVQLILTSIQEWPVTVVGLNSCTSDDDCPAGKTCTTSEQVCH